MEFVSEVDEELLFSVEEAEWACYECNIDLRLHFVPCGRMFFGGGSTQSMSCRINSGFPSVVVTSLLVYCAGNKSGSSTES